MLNELTIGNGQLARKLFTIDHSQLTKKLNSINVVQECDATEDESSCCRR